MEDTSKLTSRQWEPHDLMRELQYAFDECELGQCAKLDTQVLGMAIGYLQEHFSPLGLRLLLKDEVEVLKGDKVFICHLPPYDRFYEDEWAPYFAEEGKYVQRRNGGLEIVDLPLDDYVTKWLAYTKMK